MSRRPDDGPRPQPARTSGKAIAALVCGILSFILPIIMTIPAVILGILAQGDINRSKGQLSGAGMAITGIILSVVGPLLLLPVALLIPAVQRVREAAARTQSHNNVMQITLACHAANDNFRVLPPQAGRYGIIQNGPHWTLHVHLLPYLEQDALYRNKGPYPAVVPTYLSPNDPRPAGNPAGSCNYDGNGLVFTEPGPKQIGINRIVDGTSNTVGFSTGFGQCRTDWSRQVLVQTGTTPTAWGSNVPCTVGTPNPLFSSGMTVGMMDGSVRTIPQQVILRGAVWRNATDPADGVGIPVDW
jgi:hypothetical protein